MQIKNLEDQYGFKIFERTKKKVYTTEIGAKIVKQIYNILDTHKSLDRLITNYLNKQRVPISIGAFQLYISILCLKLFLNLKKIILILKFLQ
ncbi:hypothetical protein A2G94_04635 [Francisella endosymbiont of Ornithodoros moubata]|nr:hypothetical protein A2G94_04635 [Francisella endosymbiont of Ornithodoros moubata]